MTLRLICLWAIDKSRPPSLNIVITGFNTDIERDGVVYHVQTEDKGLDSPLILSLVYAGGEILAAKRTPYEDLIAEGFTDEALAERLNRQHRLICAAINAGRIEELKQMGARRDGSARRERVEPTPTEPIERTVPPAMPLPVEVHEEFVIETSSARHEEVVRVPIVPPSSPAKIAQPFTVAPAPHAIVSDEFIVENSAERPSTSPPQQKAEEVIVERQAPEPRTPGLPAAFESPQSPPAQPTRSTSRESAYTVYDSRRPSRPKKKAQPEPELALTILDDEEFLAGQSFTIRILLQRHMLEEEKPLGGVQISIKVLGATFRPQIYSVKTQRDGVAVVSIDIPRFSSGRAAVVIRAEAQGESVELRRVIHPAG